tara:strand:+ start:1312 stop:1596 length:285 start_codon:yes stop_codon:yes gene_type:complete
MLNELKLEIAKLVAEQIATKPQRKTVNLVVDRILNAPDAAQKVRDNKTSLRHLYIVYGYLRGKTLEQIEPKRKSEPNQWLINKLLEKHTPVEAS